MQDQKFDSALLLFNAALKADPEAFFIYQNRGICKLSLNDTLGAISDLRTNIELEPGNGESKYLLGNIYKHRRDSIRSSEYFLSALNHSDNELSVQKLLYMNNFLGHYFRLNKNFIDALPYYDQVKKITPRNSSVHINSAVCYFRLDSLEQFCHNMEQAFLLGGNVNCIALKAYCKGCSHLLDEMEGTDTLSTKLDTRLKGIIPDTIYHPFVMPQANLSSYEPSKKVRVYFNQLWQICLPENATYYREAFWSDHYNFFGGDFKDYFLDGRIYAEGRTNRAILTGPYKCYYRNGNIKIKGQFLNGLPNGKWTYFLANGDNDYEIDFFFDEFTIHVINKSNPNFKLNSGTSQFRILLEKWGNIEFVLSGEFLDKKREGKWQYSQNGEKIIWENYKKGKFKKGFIATNMGSVSSKTTRLDASILVPPQLKQVRNLYFDSVETPNYYRFISISGL